MMLWTLLKILHYSIFLFREYLLIASFVISTTILIIIPLVFLWFMTYNLNNYPASSFR